MGHSYLGESPRCHIVGSTTLNILQQGWDCNRFLNCASVERDFGKFWEGGFSCKDSSLALCASGLLKTSLKAVEVFAKIVLIVIVPCSPSNKQSGNAE